MIERGYGRVINIASLAARVYGAPGRTLYPAAKGFLIKMSESLALELLDTGVTVTAVCPGYTMSEFHDVNGTRDSVSKMPGLLWMDADTVAREGLDAALAGRVMYVNGTVNKVIAAAMRHIPTTLARQIMQRQARAFHKVRELANAPGSLRSRCARSVRCCQNSSVWLGRRHRGAVGRRELTQLGKTGLDAALHDPRQRPIQAICLALDVLQHQLGEVKALLTLVGAHPKGPPCSPPGKSTAPACDPEAS
jgi:hypothetical protein